MTNAAPANPRWSPERLDVKSMARSAGQIQGDFPRKRFPRLMTEVVAGADSGEPDGVLWQAKAELRADAQGEDSEIWLHLQVNTSVPLQCQRCLGPVDMALMVDRWFRFVADEDTALAQDDESDEDLLVLQPSMSLLELIEDELLMELPLVPMHEVCPVKVVLQAQDPTFGAGSMAEERANPFAALAKLKK